MNPSPRGSSSSDATGSGLVAIPERATAGDGSALLVTINGPDRPGVAASLMELLHAAGASLQDVEQVFIRGHLTLALVAQCEDVPALEKELLYFGARNGYAVEFAAVDAASSQRSVVEVVSVLGHRIDPAAFGAVSAAIAGAGGNILKITRLSRYPVFCYEFRVDGADPQQLRAGLAEAARRESVDVAVQTEGIDRRAKRLVALDVDMTLIQDEIVDLLAEEAGCGEAVVALTERAMNGELDFEAALRARVALLKGTPATAMERVSERIRITPGARTFLTTLKRMGFHVIAISGGFTQVLAPLVEYLGLDGAHANELDIRDGVLTGSLVGPVMDRERKARVLVEESARLNIPIEQTVAIGDGANDVEMLNRAGLGVAFNARGVAREAADAELNVPYLDAILFMLGITRQEVEAARLTSPNPPPVDPDSPVEHGQPARDHPERR